MIGAVHKRSRNRSVNWFYRTIISKQVILIGEDIKTYIIERVVIGSLRTKHGLLKYAISYFAWALHVNNEAKMAWVASQRSIKQLCKGRQTVLPLLRCLSNKSLPEERKIQSSDRLTKPLTQRHGKCSFCFLNLINCGTIDCLLFFSSIIFCQITSVLFPQSFLTGQSIRGLFQVGDLVI